jgi:hypothetical protein
MLTSRLPGHVYPRGQEGRWAMNRQPAARDEVPRPAFLQMGLTLGARRPSSKGTLTERRSVATAHPTPLHHLIGFLSALPSSRSSGRITPSWRQGVLHSEYDVPDLPDNLVVRTPHLGPDDLVCSQAGSKFIDSDERLGICIAANALCPATLTLRLPRLDWSPLCLRAIAPGCGWGVGRPGLVLDELLRSLPIFALASFRPAFHFPQLIRSFPDPLITIGGSLVRVFRLFISAHWQTSLGTTYLLQPAHTAEERANA